MRISAFILLILVLVSCEQNKPKTTPKVERITESVYASVKIQPLDFYDVYPSVPGILDSLLVNEGDPVESGQEVALIVSQNPELLRENARLNYQLAEEQYKGRATLLATIEEEIEMTQQQLRIDSLNYFRQKNLREQGIGSEAEFENKKLKYDLSRKNLETQKQRYSQTKRELESTYKRSKNDLARAESNLTDYTIRSRLNGMVYHVLKKEGEYVSTMEVIARIGKAGEFIIEMSIDEVDIAEVALGQKVMVVLDAYGDRVFEAVVSKIYPMKDERNQTFTVEAIFQNPPRVLYAGLTGEANVLLRSKEGALTIPINYLIEEGKVLTEEGEREVETGLRTLDRVEILSGIDSSTVLLQP